jgi:conjugative relaxase-like TrwC/TraI family protein
MLTIAKIKAHSAGAYRQYLEGRAAPSDRGDYYLKDGNVVEAPGAWTLGQLGAAALGLKPSPRLTSEAFSAVMNGNHPVTGEPLRRAGADATRVVALDLTYSAPKSVSVLWAFADNELRGELEAALERSVDAAMAAALERVPVVRQRVDGRVRHFQAQELIASSWRHTTSRAVEDRAPDPQLHVHRLLHAAVRQDGQVVAVDSRPLLQHQRELGARFRSQLARELEQLGFAIERGTGRGGRYFELAGVERPLIEAFSERHAQITKRIGDAQASRIKALEAIVRRGGQDRADRPTSAEVVQALRELESLEFHGRLSPAQERAEAISSRAAKSLLTRGDLEREWWQTAQPYGFDARSIEALRAVAVEEPDRAELAALIASRLTEFDATFTATQGRATAVESAAGLGVDVELGDELYEELLERGVILELEEGRQTTVMHRAMERDTVAIARELAAAASVAPLDDRVVQVAIERIDVELGAVGAGIAPEQADAIRAASADRLVTFIEGQAGTGKSTALQAIGRIHQDAGREILVTSTGGLAAARLQTELARAGVQAQTLTTEALRRRITDGKLELTPTMTIVHDEAALAATHEQQFLLAAVRDSRARLIEVGDGQQGQPVRAGGLWNRLSALAQQAGSRVELTTIVRAHDPADRRDQVLFRQGQHRQAVQGWADRDRITIAYRQGDAEQRALSAWHTDRRAGHDSAVFYAGSNDRVDELNARAQALRQLVGELGGDGIALSRRPYAVRAGDEVVVRVRTWHDELGRIENGTPGRVVAVVDGRAEVMLGDGRQGMWSRGQLDAADLRLAYVQHPWPGQGLTVDRLHYIHDELASARSTYVSATRSRNEFHVYCARETLEAIRDGRDELSDLDVLAESLGQSEPDAPSIDLRVLRSVDDDCELVAEPAPAMVEPEERTTSERDGLHVSDPLDAVRAALGPGLVARLPDTDAPVGLRRLTREQLQALADERQVVVDRFPFKEALELRGLKRDREIAVGQRDSAQRDVAALQRRRAALGRLRRHERAELNERIEMRQRSADGAQRDIDRVEDREAELVADGRHPTEWIASDGRAAVEWAHVRRELDVRRELELRDAVDRAIADPPRHVRETLGDRPDRSVQRHRYDQLAGELERYRLEHDVNVDRHGSLGPSPTAHDQEREQLARRVVESRLERALPQEPPNLALDDTAAFDLDV